jgi:hypothetical protein
MSKDVVRAQQVKLRLWSAAVLKHLKDLSKKSSQERAAAMAEVEKHLQFSMNRVRAFANTKMPGMIKL